MVVEAVGGDDDGADWDGEGVGVEARVSRVVCRWVRVRVSRAVRVVLMFSGLGGLVNLVGGKGRCAYG